MEHDINRESLERYAHLSLRQDNRSRFPASKMLTPAAEIPLDIRDTFGQFVIATILGSVFYGITLLQTGMYLSKYKQEQGWTLVTVIFLCVMDTMSWILELYTTWYYFVLQYGAGPEALLNPIWALKLEPGFTYTTAFVANLFFIEKIYIVMGRNLYVSLPLVFLAVSAWGLGLAITGLVFDLNAVVSPDINHVTLAQKVVSTLVEILIMVMMCYVFRSGQLGFSRRTDRSLSRLIIFAASRGVIMSIVQIVYTVVFFVYPHKLIWVVFHFILGKLFSNSVLASLNVRKIMRGNHSTEPTSTFHLSTGDLSGGSEPQTNSSSTRRTQNSGFMQFAPGKTHDSTMSIEV